MNNQQSNPFDDMGGIPDQQELDRIQAENNIQWGKLENLIHRVFKQNKAGEELLELWKEALIMTPTATANSTQLQVGIEEGKREFIRNIYLTIKNVESK